MTFNGSAAVHRLGIRDTEVLAEYLLEHLSMELRAKLMGELPVIYGTLYPDVNPEILTEHVKEALWNARNPQPSPWKFEVHENNQGI
jgi:hypothetical protein